MKKPPSQIQENSNGVEVQELDEEKSTELPVHVKNSEPVPEEAAPSRISDPIPHRRSGDSVQDANLNGMGGGFSPVAGSMKRRRGYEEDGSDDLHGSGEGSNVGSSVTRMRSKGKSKNVAGKRRRLGESCSRKSPRLNLDLVTELLQLPGRGSRKVEGKKCVTRVKLLRNRVVETPVQVRRASARKGGVRSIKVDKNVELEKGGSVRRDSARKNGRWNRNVEKDVELEKGDAVRRDSTRKGVRRNEIVENNVEFEKGDSIRSESVRRGSRRNHNVELENQNVGLEKGDGVRRNSAQNRGRRKQIVELEKVESVRRDSECKGGVRKGNQSSASQLESKLADSGSDFSIAGKRDIDVIEEGPASRTVEPELRFILVDCDNTGPSGLDDSVKSDGIECEMSEAFENGDVNSIHASSTPDRTEMGMPVGKADLNCQLNVSSEKCLRTRKIVFQVGDSDKKKSRKTKERIIENREQTPKSKEFDRKHPNEADAYFIGLPIPEEEAHQRWGWRYELKSRQPKTKGWILNADEEDEIILNVESHYAQAVVAGRLFNIGDCAFIKGEGKEKHIGRILEFFKTVEGEDYFRVQWFYKAVDTVMKDQAAFHNKKRIFYSSIMNDNPLDCLISKVNIVELPPAMGQLDTIPPADFYYDMEYCVEYSTFRNMQSSNSKINDLYSSQPVDSLDAPATASPVEVSTASGPLKGDLTLLDIFAGCGGMSTGLSIGAKLSGINLVKRWAVDMEESACDSFKFNHPETQVRNVAAEDYLELLKRWEKLCHRYVLSDLKPLEGEQEFISRSVNDDSSELENDPDGGFEVAHIVDICYGDPNETGKKGVYFMVRWKGYGPDDDTWEPMNGLSNCQECIEDFVRSGLRSKILPLPGEVGVICGGPPCQGISGYNRHRKVDEPLTDEKNQQLVVFMNIVEFLKPKYVLMENVVDIMRLDGGSLGRYALSRLVHMKYQARLGTIAAGCYGLAQFRLRVFLWGALPSEKLPPFPLPTHDVVIRYWPPPEFERNTVAYDEGQPRELEDALFLRDAISDLPPVANDETREEMEYHLPPQTRFQEYIRLSREEMMGSRTAQSSGAKDQLLYDHRPYNLNEDNYLRVCQIPHRKGANFRDLPGLIVDENNVVHRDTTKEDALLPSGNLLVPECSVKLDKGKCKRPFGRVWWDETVPTVLTFPHFKNQAILHPEQDRVLTIREMARLQGFPDFYRFTGSTRARYSQIGNAVAIPVGRALGYGLGMAYQNLISDKHLMILPPNFSILRPLHDNTVEVGYDADQILSLVKK